MADRKDQNPEFVCQGNSVKFGLQKSILENEAIATNYLLVETLRGGYQLYGEPGQSAQLKATVVPL